MCRCSLSHTTAAQACDITSLVYVSEPSGIPAALPRPSTSSLKVKLANRKMTPDDFTFTSTNQAQSISCVPASDSWRLQSRFWVCLASQVSVRRFQNVHWCQSYSLNWLCVKYVTNKQQTTQVHTETILYCLSPVCIELGQSRIFSISLCCCVWGQ